VLHATQLARILYLECNSQTLPDLVYEIVNVYYYRSTTASGCGNCNVAHGRVQSPPPHSAC